MDYRFINYSNKYLKSCANLVKDTWNLHYRFKDLKKQDSVYIAYVKNCIDYSDFMEIIVDENDIVHGIMFGSNEKRSFLKHLKCTTRKFITYIWILVGLIMGDYGDRAYATKSFKISSEINEMGEKYSDQFDSEINLFIVSKELRGKKYGYRLMNNYIDFCKDNNLITSYLWTDLSCTYSFYEKYGFELYNTFYHDHLTQSSGQDNGMIYSMKIR